MNKTFLIKKSHLTILISLLISLPLFLSSCSNNGQTTQSTNIPQAGCPSLMNVTVSIQQWSQFTKDALGECVNVTTIITNSSIDPHEFEPTANDINTIANSDFVVINGLGYDDWAKNAAVNAKVSFFEFGSTSGTTVYASDENEKISSDNPHLWFAVNSYSDFANSLKDAVINFASTNTDKYTSEFTDSINNNFKNFEERNQQLQNSINEIRNSEQEKGQSVGYVATESVANYFANAIGLTNLTPEGFANATANESEPAPGDVDEFLKILDSSSVKFLFYNSQEENSVSQTIRQKAESAGIKVIEVSETMPDQFTSLQDWMTYILNQGSFLA